MCVQADRDRLQGVGGGMANGRAVLCMIIGIGVFAMVVRAPLRAVVALLFPALTAAVLTAPPYWATEATGDAESDHGVPLFPSAAHDTLQGFVRVINHTARSAFCKNA